MPPRRRSSTSTTEPHDRPPPSARDHWRSERPRTPRSPAKASRRDPIEAGVMAMRIIGEARPSRPIG
jgi:hypothetical protein